MDRVSKGSITDSSAQRAMAGVYVMHFRQLATTYLMGMDEERNRCLTLTVNVARGQEMYLPRLPELGGRHMQNATDSAASMVESLTRYFSGLTTV